MTVGKRSLNIEYTGEIWKEGRTFIARAVPLDVMSCGGSAKQARDNLREAVALFVSTARDQRTLAAILRECGYRRTRSGWQPPQMLAREHVRHAVNA